MTRKISVLGLEVDDLDLEEASQVLVHRAMKLIATQVAFVNADCINLARSRPAYRGALKQAGYLFADGVGMELAARFEGKVLRDNVNGTDLFPVLARDLARAGGTLFLLGARPGVADGLRDKLQATYGDGFVVGTQDGYFSAEEVPEVCARIRRSQAHVLLVALGAPRQDLFLARYGKELGVPVQIGVGGLFDFESGRVPRAPKGLRKLRLEWLFRLFQEPSRLWRRYLIGNPRFLRDLFWKGSL